MKNITVYSQPNCQPCKATYRQLDKQGVKYDVVDVTENPDARALVVELGFQESPVVLVRDEHATVIDSWSGYRREQIIALGAAA